MKKILDEERVKYIAQALGEEPSADNSVEVVYRDPIKQLGFAMINHVLTLDNTLSDGAYRTYAMLMYHWQNKKVAWMGIELLATERGVAESTIRGHLRELEDAKLITRQRRMGRSSLTHLEDLPQRLVKMAQDLLSNRLKTSARSAKKLAELPLDNQRREEEQIEEEENKKSPAENPAGAPPPNKKPEEKKKQEPSGKDLFAMSSSIAKVCKLDIKLNKNKLFPAAKRLLLSGYQPCQVEEVYQPGGDYWFKDWRGKKKEPPTIAIINDSIKRLLGREKADAVWEIK